MSEHTPEARAFNDEFDRLMDEGTICPICLNPAEEVGPVTKNLLDELTGLDVGYGRCPRGHVYILEVEDGT